MSQRGILKSPNGDWKVLTLSMRKFTQNIPDLDVNNEVYYNNDNKKKKRKNFYSCY